MSKGPTMEERTLDALKGATSRGFTTAEVMAIVKDDRNTVYGALNRLRIAGRVQRGGSGRTSAAGKKDVRWRLNPKAAEPATP